MTDMDVSVLVSSGRPWAEVRGSRRRRRGRGVRRLHPRPLHAQHRRTPRSSTVRLEAWTLLSALSQQTSSCRLGPLVLGGTYRHPAVVANQVAALDHVSGGRAIAGLGAGWQVNEHAAYGIDLLSARDRSDRFEESVHVVASLLREPRTTFDGRFFQLHDAPNQPASGAGPAAGPGRAAAASSGPCAPPRSTPTCGTPGARPSRSPPRAPVLDERCAEIGPRPGRDPAGVRLLRRGPLRRRCHRGAVRGRVRPSSSSATSARPRTTSSAPSAPP